MKKKLALLLIVVAIPLYVWDSHLFLSGILGRSRHIARPAMALNNSDFIQQSTAVHFVEKGRSPFSAYKEPPKPAMPAQSHAKKPSPPKNSPALASPPKITITGIMWHPTNPIAMIVLPDGSSTAVKTGQTIGTFQIRKIEKNRISVAVEGTEFWITR